METLPTKVLKAGGPGGVGKSCVFREASSSYILPRKMSVHQPCHLHPPRCADGGTCGVINNVGRRQSLCITPTAHFSVTCT